MNTPLGAIISPRGGLALAWQKLRAISCLSCKGLPLWTPALCSVFFGSFTALPRKQIFIFFALPFLGMHAHYPLTWGEYESMHDQANSRFPCFCAAAWWRYEALSEKNLWRIFVGTMPG
jgi:hypothetical protein